MVKLICRECGYKFDSIKGNKCPYCSGSKLEKEKSAEELVESIE